MHTIFAIAPTRESLESLLDSFEENSIDLRNVNLILPEDGTSAVPEGASHAKPSEDDFAGSKKRAWIGGTIGAIVGMGAFVFSSYPGLIAVGAGTATMGVAIACGAGGMLGTMLGLEIPEPTRQHYETRLLQRDRLISVRVPSTQLDDFVGLFKREGMQDIAILDERVETAS